MSGSSLSNHYVIELYVIIIDVAFNLIAFSFLLHVIISYLPWDE